MVNLEWYRTFKAIYQTGTLTKAAQELMISQPNVSIQLASLESYIGHPLFIRLPRRMEPTEYGKLLYTQVVGAIDNLEKVETEFKKNALSKKPTINLGTPIEVFHNFLAPNLDKFKPHLIAHFALADQLSEMLVKNDLDAAIITQQSRSEDFITYEPLITETLCIVCNSNADTSEFEKYIADDNLIDAEKWLLQQIWYSYGSNLPMIRRFWRENFKKRPLIKPQAIIPDYNSLLCAIAHNKNSVAVASDYIAHNSLKERSVRVLWQGFVPSVNTLYLAYNKSKVSPLLLDDIRFFLQDCLTN